MKRHSGIPSAIMSLKYRALLAAVLMLNGLVIAPCCLGDDSATADARDAVSFREPTDPVAKRRVTSGADWLKRHLVTIQRPGDQGLTRVVAWKDPTLEPHDPKLLAGYAITDTLWASEALKAVDPDETVAMEAGLKQLGWPGNGLHDVLFHPVPQICHRPADDDIVHGHSLGRFPTADGRMVNLRVMRQRWDADFEAGHPKLFAEHAVYQAIHEHWQGQRDLARRRIRQVIADDRKTDPQDAIFWDATAGVLVDHVTRADWDRFHRQQQPAYRSYSFKLGALLYAIRLLELEQDVGATLDQLKHRLWSAQAADGGVQHFLDVQTDGTAKPTGHDATGEATAIAVLSETVDP